MVSFYEQELLKTNIKENDLYIIEKIISKKLIDKYFVQMEKLSIINLIHM